MEQLEVRIAHDYECPWCWIAFFQAQRLAREFPGIRQLWESYELLPQATRTPEERPQPSPRFLALAETERCHPPAWPRIVTSHFALEGAEYVQVTAPEKFDQYNEAVYRAFWEKGQDISDIELLSSFAAACGLSATDFTEQVSRRAFADRITPFKEPAYAKGITHVTTFQFLGEQCAEAPYATIREMAERYSAWYGK